jgi:rhomboid protease GluP
MIRKLKYLSIPYLIITVCFTIVYSYLDWALYLNSDIIHLQDEIVKFWIPVFLPFLPVFIWLYPRIKNIEFKKRTSGDPVFFYCMIASFSISVPAIVTQSYLETAIGKLTNLSSATQINKVEKTRYYTLKKAYYDKAHSGIHLKSEITGRYNEDLNFYVYFAVPVLDAEKDTGTNTCPAWLGYTYHKTLDNTLSKEEHNTSFKAFEKECIAEFNLKRLEKFNYLDRIRNTVESYGLTAAAEQQQKYAVTGNPVILKPVEEPFEARNGSSFEWISGTFGLGLLIWLLMIIIPKLKDQAEIGSVEKNAGLVRSKMNEVASFFIPGEGHFVTAIIIDLNIIIFLLMAISGLGVISFEPKDLIAWGANYRPLTEGSGQWLRLITNTFLHSGIIHIAMNMYGLLIVGILLEPVLGRAKFAAIYLAAGIIASLASLYWHDPLVSVGASGAIFGMYGVFFAFLLNKIFPSYFSSLFLVNTVFFIGYNVIVGFLRNGTDNAAHIGGLVSGFLIGLMVSGMVKNEQVEKEDKTRFKI